MVNLKKVCRFLTTRSGIYRSLIGVSSLPGQTRLKITSSSLALGAISLLLGVPGTAIAQTPSAPPFLFDFGGRLIYSWTYFGDNINKPFYYRSDQSAPISMTLPESNSVSSVTGSFGYNTINYSSSIDCFVTHNWYRKVGSDASYQVFVRSDIPSNLVRVRHQMQGQVATSLDPPNNQSMAACSSSFQNEFGYWNVDANGSQSFSKDGVFSTSMGGGSLNAYGTSYYRFSGHGYNLNTYLWSFDPLGYHPEPVFAQGTNKVSGTITAWINQGVPPYIDFISAGMCSNRPVSLTSSSFDPDNPGTEPHRGIVLDEWEITAPDHSVKTSSGQLTTFTPVTIGDYTVKLTSTDDEGMSNSQTKTISVLNAVTITSAKMCGGMLEVMVFIPPDCIGSEPLVVDTGLKDRKGKPVIVTDAISGRETTLNIDLAIHDVPRFTENMNFQVTASTDGMSDTKMITALLPVVLVPGIDPISHGQGGDESFPALEKFLVEQTDACTRGYGYQKNLPGTCYPTIHTLAYDRTNASFVAAADRLGGLIEGIRSLTYADKVNLVTHSKGGLVARYYLTHGGENRVNTFIATVPPNTGSVAATGGMNNPLGNDLRNLYPLWAWFRQTPRQKYIAIPNLELQNLNKIALPEIDRLGNLIHYAIFYTDAYATAGTNTLFPYANQSIDVLGDRIVPKFSMLGYIPDFNSSTIPTPMIRIPAFSSSTLQMEEVNIPGGKLGHIGYLEQQSVMNEVLARIFGRQCQ